MKEICASAMVAKAIKYLLIVACMPACAQPTTAPPPQHDVAPDQTAEQHLVLGAERTTLYLPLLRDKRVGIVANQTSTIGNVHLVDTLLRCGVDIVAVFAPEHGFRGKASAGAKVSDSTDPQTGLPIISLYGKSLIPSEEQMKGLDVVVFDIQDVGARFYTYISTMSYMMQACARYGLPMIVLDRPNPNGHYVDGPVLDTRFASFVGLHPVPVVHGLTVGEYAQMVNGEGWLPDSAQCALTVIAMEHYSHDMEYELPIAPSPNLPNQKAIYLYPSLCFFEGTVVSAGRGTDKPFQQFGYPNMPSSNTSFTPKSIPGVADHPKFENELCQGIDLSKMDQQQVRNMARLDLQWLLTAFKNYPDKKRFFLADFFDKLAGSSELRKQIQAGRTEAEIRASWQPGLEQFRIAREKYLLYP